MNEVYPQVLQTANDVVIGLIIVLLLAIPFAIICERLFVSGNTIGQKVTGFGAFFVATFLFFYILHPAFELATTPVIIFLAFVIIALSALVIGLLYTRFEHEMQLIRMSGLGQHRADVSRFGTILATGQLGISNMRRRPQGTFLTASTVVLMTFILMTFVSFNSAPQVITSDKGLTPPFDGVEAHHLGFNAIEDEIVERWTKQHQEDWTVVTRRWLNNPIADWPNIPLLAPVVPPLLRVSSVFLPKTPLVWRKVYYKDLSTTIMPYAVCQLRKTGCLFQIQFYSQLA